MLLDNEETLVFISEESKKEEGKKDTKGKLDWSYIPMEVLPGVARVFQKGGSITEYNGKRTWLPGIKFSKLFVSTWRHLFDWYYLGKNKDKESGEHPLCHVIANCMMLLTYIKNTEYDDRLKGINK